jgi:hypothetical protein
MSKNTKEIKSRRMNEKNTKYIWERIEMHTKFWYEKLKEIDNTDDVGIDVRITLKSMLKK